MNIISELPTWPFNIVAALIAILGAFAVQRFLFRHGAKRRFQGAILPIVSELKDLRVTEPGQVFDLLRCAYQKQEAAYTKYRLSLGAADKLILDRRWMAYRGPYPKPPELQTEDKRYRLAHFASTNLRDEEKKRQEALTLLTKLLA